jgi:hypothetical protein
VEEEYWDRVRGYHETEDYKKAYRKRSIWVEPLFAKGKDWHGMRRFRLRLLWRVNCEALMRATGQNLKRLLQKRGWCVICTIFPKAIHHLIAESTP